MTDQLSQNCTKTLRIPALGIALSVKQIPQIVGNVESAAKGLGRLETVEMRPRQMPHRQVVMP
jgi:hypothetical protein